MIEHPPANLRYLTPEEVAEHNSADECYVVIFGLVYDLSPLIQEHLGALAEPLIAAAGEDISHWFDGKTKSVRTFVHPDMGIRVPYTPMGRFIDVPPNDAASTFSTRKAVPWWRDSSYVVGRMSKNTRRLKIVNLLTQQQHVLKVCAEETCEEIMTRYLGYNAHAASYTWKALKGDKFVVLDMKRNLEENGIVDEAEMMERLSMDPDDFIPIVHLCFNDDLTVA